ncbi:MAG TPA: protein kinase [Vicinamibacterales bacterium]|jgi:TolB-like protein
MPEAIAHYKLLEQIGTGGLGDIYRARDTRLGRTVAIKFPPTDLIEDPARREALLSQARALTAISHPSVATLFEVGEDGERIYLVFEFVPGDPLSTVIGGRPIHPRRTVEFGVQLADALAEAHALNLVHGDICPATIVVTPKDRAKLLDFGMAAFTRGGVARRPPYVAPEERDGSRPDPPGDIFALGCVLFEMLTGRQAFPNQDAEKIPAPSEINRAVPAELDAIVGRMLMRDPVARSQSAAAIAAELRGVAAILDVRTATHEAQFTVASPSGGHRTAKWLAALVVVAVAAGAAWVWRADANVLWRRWFGTPPPAVVVVMPFEAEGTMPAIIADGIAEALMARLGTVGVKVVERSSLRLRRGRDPKMQARGSGAAVALTGTIRGDGDQIALVTSLVEVDTGTVLARNTFSSSKSQIVSTEASVAHTLARTLGLPAPEGAAHARAVSRVVDPEAYDRYLEGRDAEARGDLKGAIALYEEATTRDGSLAEGHAALAAASYRDLVDSARIDDEAAWQRVRRAASNALAADPDLPAAHVATALAVPTFREAVLSLTRAIEIDPSRADLYAELANQITEFDPERARILHQKALSLDPDNVESVAALGRLSSAPTAVEPIIGGTDPGRQLRRVRALAAAGRVGDARAGSKKLIEQYPDFCEARAVRVGLLAKTEQAEARKEAEAILANAAAPDTTPARVRCAAVAAAAAGDAQVAAAWLRQIADAETLLRVWAIPLDGASAQTALEQSWYPWRSVARDPAVIKGREAIQAGYARLRAEISPLLPADASHAK